MSPEAYRYEHNHAFRMSRVRAIKGATSTINNQIFWGLPASLFTLSNVDHITIFNIDHGDIMAFSL